MKRILVNGAFDVLHIGHLDLINYAKSLGDYLIVAIDTDKRISEQKGSDRPVNHIITRKTILENLKSVDKVVVFNTDEELIDILVRESPDIRVIGSDWKGKPIVGEGISKKLIFYARVNNESSTKTLQDYFDRRKLRRCVPDGNSL